MTRTLSAAAAALVLAAALPLLSGCTASNPYYAEPCRIMQMEVKEKEGVDVAIKKLAKKREKYARQGDTASVNSADMRLKGMRLNQKYLQESLEKSSADCAPWLQDPDGRKMNSYLESPPPRRP